MVEPCLFFLYGSIHHYSRRLIKLIVNYFFGVFVKGFVDNIEKSTVENQDFRRVLYTGKYSQLVLMAIGINDDIGEETHDDVDQFFRFEQGEGKVIIDGVEHKVGDGDAVIVPAGAKHNVVNTSKDSLLKLYTIYSPPEHQDKTVRKIKKDALEQEEHFDGKTTE
ncbi:MAG: cupin domain-containing protein [Crenarchaeota archaeon]|nr:cupin domain-containing protein [Thermoproteota archaeon]